MHYDYITQFPDNYAETVETILLSNGWYPFRDVPINHYVSRIEQMGFTIHDAAFQFLGNYYGIGIPFLLAWGRTYLVSDVIVTQYPLYEYFIGIGVSPTYKSYIVNKYNYVPCHIKDVENVVNSLIFPIGGIFIRNTPAKLSLWQKCIARHNNIKSPAYLQGRKEPTSELYICVDGRILKIEYYGFETLAIFYRSFQHLIWNYYSHIKNGGFTHNQFVHGSSYLVKGCASFEL